MDDRLYCFIMKQQSQNFPENSPDKVMKHNTMNQFPRTRNNVFLLLNKNNFVKIQTILSFIVITMF